MSRPSTLVLAWGNPGRRDDGLGPAFAAAVDALSLPRVVVDSAYQLQVEDAVQLAARDRVLFVDADRCGEKPFRIRSAEPDAGGIGFTSHSLSPGRLLALARDLFGAEPEAWLMGIRGFDFDGFGEGLSAGAQANLARAVSFARVALGEGEGNDFASAARSVDFHPEPATRG